MSQYAVLLARDIHQLVQEQIAEQQRRYEDRQEYGQQTIGDRSRVIVAMQWFAGWRGRAAFIFHALDQSQFSRMDAGEEYVPSKCI